MIGQVFKWLTMFYLRIGDLKHYIILKSLHFNKKLWRAFFTLNTLI